MFRWRQRRRPPIAAKRGTRPQYRSYSQLGPRAAEVGKTRESQLAAGIPFATAKPAACSGRFPWPTSSANGRICAPREADPEDAGVREARVVRELGPPAGRVLAPVQPRQEKDGEAERLHEEDRRVSRQDREGDRAGEGGSPPAAPLVLEAGGEPEERRPPAEREVHGRHPRRKAGGERAREGEAGPEEEALPGSRAKPAPEKRPEVDRQRLVQQDRKGDPAPDPEGQDEEVGRIEGLGLDVGEEGPSQADEGVPERQVAGQERLPEVRLVEGVHPHEVVPGEEVRALEQAPRRREGGEDERPEEGGRPGMPRGKAPEGRKPPGGGPAVAHGAIHAESPPCGNPALGGGRRHRAKMP